MLLMEDDEASAETRGCQEHRPQRISDLREATRVKRELIVKVADDRLALGDSTGLMLLNFPQLNPVLHHEVVSCLEERITLSLVWRTFGLSEQLLDPPEKIRVAWCTHWYPPYVRFFCFGHDVRRAAHVEPPPRITIFSAF